VGPHVDLDALPFSTDAGSPFSAPPALIQIKTLFPSGHVAPPPITPMQRAVFERPISTSSRRAACLRPHVIDLHQCARAAPCSADRAGIKETIMRTQRRGLPDAPGLLVRRLVALELDSAAVAGSEPGAFGDLRNLCAKCRCPDRCERDLQCDPTDPIWKTYCPNFSLLNFMTEMWWLKILR
jgi:hypothetical protein